MRTRLLAGSLVLATAAVLAGGATYAKYSDAEVAKSQSVVSGTFDLSTTNAKLSPTFPISISNARPASVWSALAGGIKQVVVVNKGSHPGALSVDVDSIVDSENTCLDPETEAGDIACGALEGDLSSQQLISVVKTDATELPWFLGGGFVCSPALPGTFKTVAAAEADGSFDFGTLEVGNNKARCLTAFTYLPDLAGGTNNLVQGDGVTFNVAMHLAQL